MQKTSLAVLVKELPEKVALTSLVLIKCGNKQPKKHSKQDNIITSLNICFLIDKFNMFINKNTTIKPV